MSSPNLISGQTALVTGASRGIGKSIALSLAEAGAEVVVNYSNSAEKAEEVVSLVKEMGGKAYSLQANISDESFSYASLVIVPIGPVFAYIKGTSSKFNSFDA